MKQSCILVVVVVSHIAEISLCISHHPLRRPLRRMRIPFPTRAEVIDLTVLSDLPIVAAISFCVIFGFVSIQRNTAVSSKVQFKVRILLFELSDIALWISVFGRVAPTSISRLRSSLCSPRMTLRRKSSTNSVVGDTLSPLYEARTNALRKYHECSKKRMKVH